MADAQDSGSCGGDFVQVQVLSSAPYQLQHNAATLQKAENNGFQPFCLLGKRKNLTRETDNHKIEQYFKVF